MRKKRTPQSSSKYEWFIRNSKVGITAPLLGAEVFLTIPARGRRIVKVISDEIRKNRFFLLSVEIF
jgi:hypothetical protein